MVAASPHTDPSVGGSSDDSLDALFDDLADSAEKISSRAGGPITADELALVAAALERASAALAASVQQAAYAIGSAPRDRRHGVPPPHARRAISWRLHGLANALRRCRELSAVVSDAVERSRQTSQAG